MAKRTVPTRTEAVLRLVHAAASDDQIVVDGVVATSDGGGDWPGAGFPMALRLELPQATWMADALAQLLEDWAAEDAVVTATIVTTSQHKVARMGHNEAYVSLELLATA